jgi:hypothetical protein
MRTNAIWMAALGAALSAAVLSGDAQACGGEWVPEIDWRVPGVQNAERQLDKGKPDAAGGSVLRMMPNIKTYKPTTGGLIGRGLRTLAVSLVRTNGALNVAREVPRELHATWLGKSEEQKKQNLEWAVATLRAQARAKKNDPAVLSDLGEALAKLDGAEDEAAKLLGDLANEDLIATPHAYAALARLRGAAGDAEGSRLALKRCEAMAKAATLCSAGASPKA